MYLSQTNKTNYVISDNQDIWTGDYSEFLKTASQVIDFKANDNILTDFAINYDFPENGFKIAYFSRES